MSTSSQPIDTTSYVRTLSKGFQITELQARLLTQIMLCGGNITKAAEAAGTDRRVHYTCLGYSQGYQDAYRKVIVPALGLAAAGRLLDRAINGDIVLYKGKIVRDSSGEPIRVFSDIAQIFASKLGGLTDQPQQNPGERNGPTVIINMPDNGRPPAIEVTNESE